MWASTYRKGREKTYVPREETNQRMIEMGLQHCIDRAQEAEIAESEI